MAPTPFRLHRRFSVLRSFCRTSVPLAATTLAVVLLSGCSYPNRGHSLARVGAAIGLSPETAAFDPPRQRFGLMPFDAWYAPWKPLDVDALGHHRHSGDGLLGTSLGSPRWKEASRGMLYTERGGFLDIAHLRNAVDLTAFVHREVAPRLQQNGTVTLDILGAEPDLYRLTLSPPAHASAAERADAAVEIAGRVGYLMTTWHEVLTWYGYRGMGIITEQPSAFSYDDAASHRVGVELAKGVLREVAPGPAARRSAGTDELDEAVFDAAVTAALPRTLHRLGVVSPDEATARMRAVEGQWWAGGSPLLRVIDLGLEGQPLRAQTVPGPLASLGSEVAGPALVTPVSWSFDPAVAPAGVPLRDWYDITIEPRTFEADAIRRAAGLDPDADLIHPRTHFAHLGHSLEAAEAP